MKKQFDKNKCALLSNTGGTCNNCGRKLEKVVDANLFFCRNAFDKKQISSIVDSHKKMKNSLKK